MKKSYKYLVEVNQERVKCVDTLKAAERELDKIEEGVLEAFAANVLTCDIDAYIVRLTFCPVSGTYRHGGRVFDLGFSIPCSCPNN